MTNHGQSPTPGNNGRDWSFVLRSALTTTLFWGTVAHLATLHAAESSPPKIYAHLVDPREHPDYERRAVRPPNWETFQNRTHLNGLRYLSVDGGRIVHYAEDLEQYTKTFQLGDVVSAVYPILFTKNLTDLVDELRRRNLYLFGVCGYVPGMGPGSPYEQFKTPVEALKLFDAKLGSHWLSMDVGEQDGRYIGIFAPQMYPTSASRLEQYFNFQRHFQRLTDDLGNKASALLSLNFGHHLLKEGIYTLVGAETAQGLPNCQVYYAFIRGAGKQYGVLSFNIASIYNRWGFKTYGAKGVDQYNYRYGPTAGTSLSLLKRLLYTGILHNCAIIGCESGFFEGEKLSPIGRVQQAAGKWIETNGQPGAMLTPIAVMTDFLAGWTFPRHLYTSDVYRVWGNLPYEAGDYLTDGVLDLLYPGYQNSAHYHDESGFLVPAPYGDAADCLLSDAPGWLLPRYSTLLVGGELSGGLEIRDKLAAYVQGGGHLVITAGNVAKMPGGLAGVRVTGPASRFAARRPVDLEPSAVAEDVSFDLLPLEAPAGSRVLARCGPMPAAVEFSCGKGRITVFASPFGVGVDPAVRDKIVSVVDRPLPKPFPLLKHVAVLLDRVLRTKILFDAGRDLHVIACRKDRGLYTVGVFNNTFRPLPFSLVSRCGPIALIHEIPLDTSERGALGHLPPGIDTAAIGANGPQMIAGGDVRIFAVRLGQELVEEIPHVVPAPRLRGRILPLRKVSSLKEEILARPTFFEHFDGVLVDWRYLHDHSIKFVEEEAAWLGRQGLRVIVDLTSGINSYPDLRLTNNLAADYAASMAAIDDVLAKMTALGAHDLVLSSYLQPESDFSADKTATAIEATIREICRRAEGRKITVYLRVYPGKSPLNLADAVQTIKRIGAANLRLAPSTAPLAQGIAPELRKAVGLWMVGGPAFDGAGRLCSVHQPIASTEQQAELAQLLAVAPDAPIVFDVLYENHDAEYRDASFMERLLPKAATKGTGGLSSGTSAIPAVR
jgi:hypothetical protein